MNNKFIKRAAAVILGVAVLGTCAFAANDVTDADYNKETTTVNFSYSSAADKVSYIAYAATKADDGATTIGADKFNLGEIIAVNQIDDNSGAGAVNVGIDAAKLGSATHIVIMSGDSNGDLGTAAVQVAIPVEEFKYTVTSQITAKSVNLGGTEYTDVPVVKLTITSNKDGKLNVTKFTKTYKDETTDFTSATKLPANLEVTAGGNVVVDNMYVIGAPQDAIDNGFTVGAEVTLAQ